MYRRWVDTYLVLSTPYTMTETKLNQAGLRKLNYAKNLRIQIGTYKVSINFFILLPTYLGTYLRALA